MEQLISAIGVPAIVVILIIRELVPVLKNNKTNGDGLITRKEHEKSFEIFRRKDMCGEISRRIEGKVDGLKTDIDVHMKEVKALIKNDHK